METSKLRKRMPATAMLDPAILWPAVGQAFVKLDPRTLMKNPVIFVLEVVTTLATVLLVRDMLTGGAAVGFTFQITLWLWFTVLFANFAEAVAEGRGRAQADTLRRARTETRAKRLIMPRENHDTYEGVEASQLQPGDLVLCEAGDMIPADGEVIEGIASVNEAAITGESAPVIRESGGDRSAVTGGTTVISDRIVVRVAVGEGSSFLDRMIALVEGAQRQKTPNEIALSILLVGLTLIFVFATASVPSFASYADGSIPIIILIALFVTLIPTTIGALLSAIGIAGMDRLVRFNVLAMSGRAVEAAGDVNTLLLDKTGTITFGNRLATELIVVPGVSEREAAEAALLASAADETAEGRSIVTLMQEKYGLNAQPPADAKFIPFSASTRLSGIDIGARRLRKGAIDAVTGFARQAAGRDLAEPPAFRVAVERIARSGGTPLGLTDGERILGVIHLKDVVKADIKERFIELRRMGIKTVMITGDNPVTAAAIASEAGVDDFIAEATPEDKLRYIRAEQSNGRLIAMCGDGTNDAPALAQADVGVAMQSGTQAAREAGNMVDLDSNPTKLLEVVEIGKQLLMTRGSLTAFSIANDVAKYFAIIPAMFVAIHPQLGALNIMQLASPQSAVLSAIIFNALVIIALIPLALRGVKYRPVGAAALLRRNLLVYGLGGIVVPFIGIKAIDLAVNALHLV